MQTIKKSSYKTLNTLNFSTNPVIFKPEEVKNYLNTPMSLAELCNDEVLLEKTMKKQFFLENKGLFAPEKYFQGFSHPFEQENQLDQIFSLEELEKRGESPSKLQEKQLNHWDISVENVKKTGFKSFSQHIMKENSDTKALHSPQTLGKKLIKTKKNETFFNYKKETGALCKENPKKNKESARNKTKSIFIQTKENVLNAVLIKPAVKRNEKNYTRGVSSNLAKKRLI